MQQIRADVAPEADGYRVTTYDGPYANGWGVGVIFPTARGAQMVATAIELAAADAEDS